MVNNAAVCVGGGRGGVLEQVGVNDGLVKLLDEGLKFGGLPELLQVGVAPHFAELVKSGLHANVQGIQTRLDLQQQLLETLTQSPKPYPACLKNVQGIPIGLNLRKCLLVPAQHDSHHARPTSPRM